METDRRRDGKRTGSVDVERERHPRLTVERGLSLLSFCIHLSNYLDAFFLLIKGMASVRQISTVKRHHLNYLK